MSTDGIPEDALFRALFDNADIGMALVDAGGISLRVNRALCAMLSTDAPDLIGGRLLDWSAVDPDHADDLRAGRRAGATTEYPYPTGDGRTVWGRTTISAVDGGCGRPTHFIALIEDVTGHRRARAAASEAEAKYRGIFENALEGIFQTTADGHYLSANPALARIYGYESADDLIAGLTDIASQLYVDPGRRDAFRQALRDADVVTGFESEVYRRDGSVIWISENCRAVRDGRGELLHYEGTVEDITARKRTESRLIHDALHDALTGLPNRMLFTDRLKHAIARSTRRDAARFAVLFLDCDRFKLINDSLGHLAGDRFLIELGRRIGECLRDSDTLGRLGGDEFAILAEDLREPDDALHLAHRIHAALQPPFRLEGEEVFVSVSVGIAMGPREGRDPTAFLRDADTAMYQAKDGGRGRTVVFESHMHQRAVRRLKVESELQRALERREFEVYYQPIVALGSGRPRGVESLIRWRHPERGLIGPDVFIPIAEENGLIADIGAWVLEDACRRLMVWRENWNEARRLFLSVNLSPAQVRSADVVDRVRGVLERSGFPPASLKLEITETAIMENPVAAKSRLEALKELGIGLSIDDFGTGYSSLGHLHAFPIDTLKIDKSFVRPLGGASNGHEIVRTILALGHSLDMAVVAEGIETDRQAEWLADLGCRMGQGFLFSRPLPSGEIEAALFARADRAMIFAAE